MNEHLGGSVRGERRALQADLRGRVVTRSGVALPPARAVTAAVYAELRDRILSCELEPGARLVLRDLAAAMGVSFAPITGALKALSNDGLVEIRPRSGCVVTSMSAEDIHHVFEMRIELEPFATRLAVDRATDAELAEFRRTCFRAFEALPSWAPGPLNRRAVLRDTEIHDDFHLQVARLSRNPRLVRAIEGLLVASQRLYAIAYRRLDVNGLPMRREEQDPAGPTVPRTLPPGHVALADALCARDEDAAVRHMAGHIQKGHHHALVALGMAAPAAVPVGQEGV